MARYCEICKKPLEIDRAENMPETKLCAEHAEQIKEFGGEFMRVNESKNLGKEGSLKKTTSTVDTKKVRNLDAMDKLRRKYEESR